MSLVVFMRGVNVGGHKAFQPSRLATQVRKGAAINVGAAGTFVVPGTLAQATVRAEFLRRLPFPAELMICRGSELLELAASQPFPEGFSTRDSRCFVSVLSRRPRKLPSLPIAQPAGERWEVKIIGVSGVFVLSLWRRLQKSFVDPNGVVEKAFGVSATTRNWNTIVKVCDVLRQGRAPAPGSGARRGGPSGKLGVYQPRHARPKAMGGRDSPRKPASRGKKAVRGAASGSRPTQRARK